MKSKPGRIVANFFIGLLIFLLCFEILFGLEFLLGLYKAGRMLPTIGGSAELVSLVCLILIFYCAVSLAPGLLYAIFCSAYALIRKKGLLWRSHFFILVSVTLALVLYRLFCYPEASIGWIQKWPILFTAVLIVLAGAAGCGAALLSSKYPVTSKAFFFVFSAIAVLVLAGSGFYYLAIGKAEDGGVRSASVPAASEERINVCLITLDTLRSDFLRCYSRMDIETDAVDSLAETGVQFTSAYCQIPVTRPSHCSILTGKYPWEHGILNNVICYLDESHQTLAEVLTAHGYQSAAFVSAQPLHSVFGMKQGFQVYDDEFVAPIVLFLKSFRKNVPFMIPNKIYHLFHVKAVSESNRIGGKTVDRAVAWLSDHYRAPFFLWVHLFDPHKPYRPPAPFDTMYVRDEKYKKNVPPRPSVETLDYWLTQYAGEVTYMDRSIGRLLAAMEKFGVMDNTLIVLASDHGESFGHDYYFDHIDVVYEPLIHMPLIMRYPPLIPAGLKEPALAESIDIFPTILDILNIEQTETISGKSLLPLILGEETLNRSSVFAGTVKGRDLEKSGLRTIRTDRWKMIVDLKSGRTELYSLADDPEELRNVYEEEKDVAASLLKDLNAWIESMSRSAAPIRTIDPDDDLRQNLKDLGYLQ
jgi:arylsulfatase A-like enzyme